MKAVIKVHTNNAVHAPHLDIRSAVETCCGLVNGHWTSTNRVISCQSCIKIMAVQVAKGVPHYRELLQEALDAVFVTPAIRPISLMDTSYKEHLSHGFDGLEIRLIKEKINELTEVVNAIAAATVDSGVRCPVCGADNCEPGIVHTNINKDGNNRVWFKCIYCKQVVSVYGRKVIVFDTPIHAPHLNIHEGA